MFRYGKRTNKTFAFPRDGGLVFKYQVPFKREMVHSLPQEPQMLTSHIRWSPEADELFDSESAFRFTIVRSPAKLFPSIFHYFNRLNPVFKQAGTLARFLDSPRKFLTAKRTPFTTRNSMSFQLGFDNFIDRDPTVDELDYIRRTLKTNFDLVLVADHLAESLILLRHKLCLNLDDIATLSKNVAKRAPTSHDLDQKINDWQSVDRVIFEEANKTLWEEVDKFGRDKIERELRALKERNDELKLNCVQSYKPVKKLGPEFQDYEPPGVKIEGIELNDNVEQICTDIALSPFAHAIDIQDNQCQDSTFLRRFAHLEGRYKQSPAWCNEQ